MWCFGLTANRPGMQMLDYIRSRVMDEATLQRWLSAWRLKSKKIVFTNGCFDILHLGHVDYLEKAKGLGDKLVLGLNTDDSISRFKGPYRPIQDENSRARILASLQFIDLVVFFNEDTPLNLISTL